MTNKLVAALELIASSINADAVSVNTARAALAAYRSQPKDEDLPTIAYMAGAHAAKRPKAAEPVALTDEREAFERRWAMPDDCVIAGNRYAATRYHAWVVPEYQARWEGWQARAALAASAKAQQISTAHGPWLPSSLHEGETYCERCLTRSVFADKRACNPHVTLTVKAPAVLEAVAEVVVDTYANHEGRIEADVFLPAGTKLYTNPATSATLVAALSALAAEIDEEEVCGHTVAAKLRELLKEA